MNKTIKIIAGTLLLLFAAAPAEGRTKWKLVWSDEFDGSGPIDTTSWNFEHGFVRNHEYQWYQEQNAYRKDGKLYIECRAEHKPNPTYDATSTDWGKSQKYLEVTSSSVNTCDKREFLYGRFEVRAKFPVDLGSWPTIWMMGNNRKTGYGWPSVGETALMEFYHVGGVPTISANSCCGSDRKGEPNWSYRYIPYPFLAFKDKNWIKKFHVWRLDWDEENLKYYLDGKLIHQIPMSTRVNGKAQGEGVNPYTKPFHLRLSMALRPNDGPLANFKLPKTMIVDYVRVYQKVK